MYARILKDSEASRKAWETRKRKAREAEANKVPKFTDYNHAKAWIRDTHGISLTKRGNFSQESMQAGLESVHRVITMGVELPSDLELLDGFSLDRWYGHPMGVAGVLSVPNPGSTTKPFMALNLDNSVYGPSGEQLHKDLYASKWMASPSRDHVILHEAGHYAHYKNDPRYLGLVSRDINNPVDVKNYFDVDQKDVIARKVSGYASTQPVEFIAEMFAAQKAGIKFDKDMLDLYKLYGGPEV